MAPKFLSGRHEFLALMATEEANKELTIFWLQCNCGLSLTDGEIEVFIKK